MDESLQELEAELKSLQLRAPAPRLLDRIERDLAPGMDVATSGRRQYTSATNLSSWKWLGWRTAGLVAALTVAAVLSSVRLTRSQPQDSPMASNPVALPRPSVPARHVNAPPAERYQPVAASNVLYDLKDEGLVNVGGDTPARRLRYRYLDTYTLKSPRGNASLKWSVPRDEIRVIPASLN